MLTCPDCAAKSGIYTLSRVCCCLRLIRTLRDPKAAAACIEQAMGKDFLNTVRQAWREAA